MCVCKYVLCIYMCASVFVCMCVCESMHIYCMTCIYNDCMHDLYVFETYV